MRYVIPLRKSGPYIGPRGGKWADPEHTIPYKEPGHPAIGATPARWNWLISWQAKDWTAWEFRTRR